MKRQLWNLIDLLRNPEPLWNMLDTNPRLCLQLTMEALAEAIETGLITEEDINDAIRA